MKFPSEPALNSALKYRIGDKIQVVVVQGEYAGTWVDAVVEAVGAMGKSVDIYIPETPTARLADCDDRVIQGVPTRAIRPRSRAETKPGSMIVTGQTPQGVSPAAPRADDAQEALDQTYARASKDADRKFKSRLDKCRSKIAEQETAIQSLNNKSLALLDRIQELNRIVRDLQLQKRLLLRRELGTDFDANGRAEDRATTLHGTGSDTKSTSIPPAINPSTSRSQTRTNGSAPGSQRQRRRQTRQEQQKQAQMEQRRHERESQFHRLQSMQDEIDALRLKNKSLTDALVREKANSATVPVHKLYQEALRIYRGHSVRRDPKTAFQLALQAAHRGHARAQCLVGLCYQNGEGIEQDAGKAFAFFLLSAMRGYALSQYNVAWCFRDGDGVAVDKAEAFRWFRAAAEQGKPGAQYCLGYCFRTGEGTRRDVHVAFSWFAAAAQQGHVLAQNSMGICCEYGEGCERDEKAAFGWYKLAADAGDSQAQYNLALCFHYGRGTPKKRKFAIIYFEKAAREGNPDAVRALRKLTALATLERKYVKKEDRDDSAAGDIGDGTSGYGGVGSDSSVATPRFSGGAAAVAAASGGSSGGGGSGSETADSSRYRPWVQRLMAERHRLQVNAPEMNVQPDQILSKLILSRRRSRGESSAQSTVSSGAARATADSKQLQTSHPSHGSRADSGWVATTGGTDSVSVKSSLHTGTRGKLPRSGSSSSHHGSGSSKRGAKIGIEKGSSRSSS